MADYPNKMPTVKQEAGKTGSIVGKTTAGGIESTPVDTVTIRKNSRMQGKKSAGHIGNANINAG